ncbi:hypothetical protein scyTo_0020070 [Scyliorhinus torazame]|uniref:Glutaredoxin domain-containing protein n=1 Tax=Scyliorhinus torazame TaxID=75743 RepID=A0A401PYA0_SCYTO|nr:hypothetical protein [Scyliorhinus torazame]
MAPTGSSAAPEELKLRIQRLIDSNPVLVFSKSFCPFCKKVKELFSAMDIDIHVVELDLLEEGSNMQNVLQEMTGQKTVPSVFVNKAHLGGCDKTVQKPWSELCLTMEFALNGYFNFLGKCLVWR